MYINTIALECMDFINGSIKPLQTQVWQKKDLLINYNNGIS